MAHNQGQYFSVVLSEIDGDETFQTTVMAEHREHAVQKAALVAELLGVEVELVEP